MHKGREPASEGDRSPDEIYARFLEEWNSGNDRGFEALCKDNPDIEWALRILHSQAGHPNRGGAGADASRLHTPGAMVPQDLARGETVGLSKDLKFILAGTSSEGPPASGIPPARDEEDDPKARLGQKVGPYTLLEVLGRGGMGCVYLAEERGEITRQVALKVMRLGLGPKQILLRFEAERQALARMNHDGICRIFHSGRTEQGEPFFAMEHVEGPPLLEFCESNGVDAWGRLDLFRKVCDAVHYAHETAGVLHRDLKPSNILVRKVDGAFQPKIIDFGLAKATQQPLTKETLVTLFGQILGTPAYMSPEQARMSEDGIDRRTDVYSLGVILYELLTGTLPISMEDIHQKGWTGIPEAIEKLEPPAPSLRVGSGLGNSPKAAGAVMERRSLGRILKGDLDSIIMKAIEKDPWLRYRTVKDFSDDIGRFLKNEAVKARRHSAIYKARKLLRRHRTLVRTIAALAGVAIISIFALASWSRVERVEKSNDLLRASRDLFEEFSSLRESETGIEQAWKSERSRLPPWLPVWDRSAECFVWRSLLDAREKSERAYTRATRVFYEALQVALPGSRQMEEIKDILARFNLKLYQEANQKDGVKLGSDYFAILVQEFGKEKYGQILEGSAKVGFRTEPAGAVVFCFRYWNDPTRTRRIPVPLHAETEKAQGKEAFAGGPVIVEKVWPEKYQSEFHPTPFREGDRLLALEGVPLPTLEALALSLRGVKEEAARTVKVIRNGLETEVSWVPFPSDRVQEYFPPGRLIDPLFQLGCTFVGSPLEFGEEARVGTTPQDRPLELDLPRGSYLFVFRKEGHREVRFPVAIPGVEFAETLVLLPARDEAPEEFIYIPEGSVSTGGDPEAFQSEPWGSSNVPAFYLGRLEVTVEDWLEFLNDPEVFSRTDGDGNLEVSIPEISEELRREAEQAGETPTPSQQIPLFAPEVFPGQWTHDQEERAWRFTSEVGEIHWPVFGISHFAALEYCRWRTRKAGQEGKNWRFRLPTDLEWERAARGVDRRIYAWGDYNIWSYSRSLRGGQRALPFPVGSAPFDESIFGVRDMTGSCTEHTQGRPVEGRRYRSCRGGDWNAFDDFYFRLASRNTVLPEVPTLGAGLRLVLEIPGKGPQGK